MPSAIVITTSITTSAVTPGFLCNERAATLEDVRAEVLTPDRLNALVFGGFAAVALAIAVVGVASAACGLALARLAGSYFQDVRMPGALPVAGSAIVLLAAAVIASLLPAVRAARVDVMQALRAD